MKLQAAEEIVIFFRVVFIFFGSALKPHQNRSVRLGATIPRTENQIHRHIDTEIGTHLKRITPCFGCGLKITTETNFKSYLLYEFFG